MLAETLREEFDDIHEALRAFTITTRMMRMPGGNESEMPKLFSRVLRPRGWHETTVTGDLLVHREWMEPGPTGKTERRKETSLRERFLDGHKIDYVKNRVAFDLEWNSKDQTFDRDLYAFRAFFDAGAIDAAVLVTRGESLNTVIRGLGPALDRDGNETASPTAAKYGASTTWMGKLTYRLNAGRSGGCPVLVFGIGPKCVSDWEEPENAG